MKIENHGYEVVVRKDGEQVESIDFPILKDLSEVNGSIGDADGTFDFGDDVINALRFYVDVKNNGFEAEVFSVSV